MHDKPTLSKDEIEIGNTYYCMTDYNDITRVEVIDKDEEDLKIKSLQKQDCIGVEKGETTWIDYKTILNAYKYTNYEQQTLLNAFKRRQKEHLQEIKQEKQ